MERNRNKPGNYLVFGECSEAYARNPLIYHFSDGGRSALSALYILEEICARLQFDLDSDEEIRVCDHCDLLGGSGNGA
jgi:hypothetical protein